MAGDIMFFATVNDEPDPSLAVGFDVARGDFFGCAVHHDVGRGEQIVEPSGHFETGRAHGRRAIRIGRVKREALGGRHPRPPIGGDIRHADQFHVPLCGNRVRHPLTNHAVSVNGYSDLFFVDHDTLPVFVSDNIFSVM